jgi:hypothetical protein
LQIIIIPNTLYWTTESDIHLLKEKYERDIKIMREEIKLEMKEQIAQLMTRLKPDLLKAGLS